MTFNPLPSSLEFIKAGKLRALAVTSTTRQAVLPDTPTVAEFLPGYEATAWFGVGVPKATPSTIVDKLNSDINAGLVDTTLKARLIDLGGEPVAEDRPTNLPSSLPPKLGNGQFLSLSFPRLISSGPLIGLIAV